jgi:hypothetical protein
LLQGSSDGLVEFCRIESGVDPGGECDVAERVYRVRDFDRECRVGRFGEVLGSDVDSVGPVAVGVHRDDFSVEIVGQPTVQFVRSPADVRVVAEQVCTPASAVRNGVAVENPEYAANWSGE